MVWGKPILLCPGLHMLYPACVITRLCAKRHRLRLILRSPVKRNGANLKRDHYMNRLRAPGTCLSNSAGYDHPPNDKTHLLVDRRNRDSLGT